MCIGEVKVVGELRMLASYCGDAFHAWQNTLLLAILANLQILLLHIATLWLQHETSYLEV